MNRRQFIQLAGTVGSGLALGFSELLGVESSAGRNDRPGVSATGGKKLAIPDTGWRMWPDVQAEWKRDRIHLPAEVNLAELPVHPPTGGWESLRDDAGREVTLPATVEQFHWGEQGFRPYQGEYKFETTDDQVRNGSCLGVSWWWRRIEIPAAWIGKQVLLHIRGARQRAEVFLNERLVGYSILEELPFECDLSAACRSGENELAIRITNPGGRLDWVDGNRLNWAGREFHKSHGFGGLDRGLTISVHGAVRIADAWVLNTPAPRTITAHAEIASRGSRAQAGQVRFAVNEPQRSRPSPRPRLCNRGGSSCSRAFSTRSSS